MKQMNKIILGKFGDFSDTCGWCDQNCPDEEKYEMLVTCIRIQNEFAIIGRKVSLMLGRTSPAFLQRIINLFKIFTDHIKPKQLKERSKITHNNSEKEWRLPGCSQIFLVAQSLEQININEID